MINKGPPFCVVLPHSTGHINSGRERDETDIPIEPVYEEDSVVEA